MHKCNCVDSTYARYKAANVLQGIFGDLGISQNLGWYPIF